MQSLTFCSNSNAKARQKGYEEAEELLAEAEEGQAGLLQASEEILRWLDPHQEDEVDHHKEQEEADHHQAIQIIEAHLHARAAHLQTEGHHRVTQTIEDLRSAVRRGLRDQAQGQAKGRQSNQGHKEHREEDKAHHLGNHHNIL